MDPGSAKQNSWTAPLALVGVLCLVIAWRLIPAQPTAPAANLPEAPRAGSLATVVIDLGDSPAEELQVSFDKGNALSVLVSAGMADDKFRPEFVGSGASTLVTSIGGIENQGAGGRNWTYEVNGTPGDRSAAVAPVQSGDRVLWKFSSGE